MVVVGDIWVKECEFDIVGSTGGLSENPSQAEQQRSLDQTVAPVADTSLIGDWISASKGGADGQTLCQDFASDKLYRLNGNTAQIRSFNADGGYRSLLIYTTPSRARHQTMFSAHWQVVQGNLNLSDLSARDLFSTDGGSSTEAITRKSENVITLQSDIGSAQRYVRCFGGTGGIYRN